MKSPIIRAGIAAAAVIALGLGVHIVVRSSATSLETSERVTRHSDQDQQSLPVGTPDEDAIEQGVAKDTSGVTMTPIEMELPRAMFLSTPVNFRVENLEKPRKGRRPAFLVPEGTRNVALHRPVLSSDDDPIIGEIEMITDGDKEGVDGSYVELGPFHQYVTVDLGARYNIYAIVVWRHHGIPRVYYDTVVQAATDVDIIENARTLFNNDTDNSIGLGVGKDKHYIETYEGKLIDAKGVQARYIRVHGCGNTSNDVNHYAEIEVYGLLAE